MANIVNLFPGGGGSTLKVVTGSVAGSTAFTTFAIPGLTKVLAFSCYAYYNYSADCYNLMRTAYDGSFATGSTTDRFDATQVEVSGIAGNIVTYKSKGYKNSADVAATMDYMALGE